MPFDSGSPKARPNAFRASRDRCGREFPNKALENDREKRDRAFHGVPALTFGVCAPARDGQPRGKSATGCGWGSRRSVSSPCCCCTGSTKGAVLGSGCRRWCSPSWSTACVSTAVRARGDGGAGRRRGLRDDGLRAVRGPVPAIQRPGAGRAVKAAGRTRGRRCRIPGLDGRSR